MNFGLPELVIILVIVLLLFGGTRLPKLARSLGESFKELRDGFSSKGTPAQGKKKSTENKKTAPKNTSKAETVTEAEKTFSGFEPTESEDQKDQNKSLN